MIYLKQLYYSCLVKHDCFPASDDWARMMDIEFVHITKDTTPEKLEEKLLVKDLIWK